MALEGFSSHVCPMCEEPGLARVDDHEWWCFSCGFRETRAPVPAAPVGEPSEKPLDLPRSRAASGS